MKEIFDNFKNNKVLIIGDIMLDTYLIGNVDRISPEAPVPVVDINEQIDKLGGASNVALNIKGLGATPLICSTFGGDQKAWELKVAIKKCDMETKYLHSSSNRKTTNKIRVIGNNTQLLRVDNESKNDLNKDELDMMIRNITIALAENDINAILIQDYNKGVVTPDLLEFITKINKKRNIPVFADPKVKNFEFYKNIKIFKPNFNELRKGLNLEVSMDKFEDIEKPVEKYMRKQNVDTFYTTMGHKGILLSYKEDGDIVHHHIQGEKRNVADVSGAGDTVISVATLLTVNGVDRLETARIANIAGGLVCEEVGVVPINKEKLLKEL